MKDREPKLQREIEYGILIQAIVRVLHRMSSGLVLQRIGG